MGKTLIKIIGSVLIGCGGALALNAYPALFIRMNEIRKEVKVNPHYEPRLELKDCFIGETGLTYGALGILGGMYLLRKK
jgi:hypothetical protein